ncbi:rCG24770, isoform CRA_c [Rattus norvegicus]|uniref:RCG24770, isoform CRA_c n=1 Tax=Rattus norvegicus TaxID=10116 RepID=A6JBY4_RAT|nr:rCG24770, isoform CRA_c [Rattus norvegicus]
MRELAAEAPGEAWPTTPVAPLRQRRCWWRARPGGGSRRERDAAAGDPSWTGEEEQADGSCGRASTRCAILKTETIEFLRIKENPWEILYCIYQKYES